MTITTSRPAAAFLAAFWAAFLAALLVLVSPAGAQDAGYEVEVTTSTQAAPADHVGKKQTERKTRVGNTEDTYGNSSESLFVIGGFTKACPTFEGIVHGDFEYSLSISEVTADDDGVHRTHYTKSAVAKLEGHVGEDAVLQRIEAEITLVRDAGAAPEKYEVTFRPGHFGEPDWDSMKRAVETARDVVVAAVMWQAGMNYSEAQMEWMKTNRCVEMVFEPPSESRMAGPKEALTVSAKLRARAEHVPVPDTKLDIAALQGVGNVSPAKGTTAEGGDISVTYTASDRPKKGHGFSVHGPTRAGAVNGEWQIDLARHYDLHFESTIVSRDPEQSAQSVASGTVRLTGAQGLSRRYPGIGPKMLFTGSGVVNFTTSPLPGRDPCSSLISGSGTAPLQIPESLIDVPAAGAAGPAHIEVVYQLGLVGGETENIPFNEEYRCVPGVSVPFPFWWSAFMSGREAEGGEMNVFVGWDHVGQNGVVATKTLTGNCGGLCDEERTVLTLREVDPAEAGR